MTKNSIRPLLEHTTPLGYALWYIDFKLLKCCQPKRQVTIDFSMAFCTLPLTVSILSKTQCSRSIFNSGFSFLAPFCSRSFLKVAQILAQLANVMAQNSSTSVQSLRRDHLLSFQHSGTLPHNSMPVVNLWGKHMRYFNHRSLLQNIFLISAKLNFHGPLVCRLQIPN